MAGQVQVGGQEWDLAAAEFMERCLRIFQTEAEKGHRMVMETVMTRGLKYLSFRCTIEEFMLRAFSSIWIGHAVVFLLQKE